MRRHSHDQTAEAARLRLELLGRELEQAGLTPLAPAPEQATEPVTAGPPSVSSVLVPDAAAIQPAGRHLRVAAGGVSSRLRLSLVRWLGELVPETFRGRTGLGSGPIALVAGLVLLAVLVSVVGLVRAGGSSEAVAPGSSMAGATPLVSTAPAPAAPGATAPSSAASAASAGVTVDIAGKVRRPGVATLPAGARVVDALEHAGGARGRVDLTSLNLARLLVDGEQILVGAPAHAMGPAAGAVAGAAPVTGELVSLNTASAEQLETLPGVGPVTSQKILSWRTEHGAFASVDELLEVDGIGEKTLAQLAPLVTL